MREFLISHMCGVAGIDEYQIGEAIAVIAESEGSAISQITDWPNGKNPESSQGGGGRWNDYYMAEPSTHGVPDEVIRQNPDEKWDSEQRNVLQPFAFLANEHEQGARWEKINMLPDED